MSYHLKTRIAIAVSLLTLSIMILLSGLALSYFEKEFKTATFNHISDNLEITANGLSNRAHHALHTLEIIRNAIPVGITSNPQKMQEFLDGLDSEKLIFDNGIVLFSPDGHLQAITPRQEDVLGLDLSFRDYIKVTLLNRQPYISAPIQSRQSHKHPIIMLTEPVFNEKDEIVAILGGTFDLYSNNFLQTLVNSNIGKAGYYMMLDQSETVILHPDKTNILRSASRIFPREQINEFLLNSSGLVPRLNDGHREMIGAFRHVSPLNWTLIALTPLDESFQPILKARTYVIFALVSLSLLTILAVRILTNRLTSPLIDLTEKVRLQASQSDTSLSLEIEPYHELGDLADSIQSLVKDVSAKRKDIMDQLTFLQSLIDTIPNPIFYKDAEYRYLGCNQAFEEFLGIRRDELIGKSVYDIAPAELAKVYQQSDIGLWEQGGEQVYETSIRYADGSIHDVIFYKKIFNDMQGVPAGLIGTYLDITDRKKSETALRASEKRFRLLVENAADAFFLHDEEGQILDVNQQACNSLGYSREELLTMKVPDVSVDFDLHAVKDLQGQMKTERIITAEDYHRRKDGSVFPVELRLCHTDQDGGLTIALARDISERKQAEETLRKALRDAQTSKEQVDNILRSTADGLVVTNRRKRVTHINQVAEEILSVSAGEVIGQPFTKLFTAPQLRKQAKDFLDKNVVEAQHLDFKINLSGVQFPRIIEARSSTLRSEAGELSGVVTLLRDVTRERELDQIKNEFISTAAHEMRTPMSVIMGYLEILMDNQHSWKFSVEEQQDFLAEAYRKSEALAQIIDDLFDISRIEAGLPLPITRSECDLVQIVSSIVQHYEKLSPKHRFHVSLLDETRAYIDGNKIAQVLENLVSNAVKYSPDGGLIELRTTSKEGLLHVEVKDQGNGMSADQVGRIFDKFYRADSSNTAISGLGLGMSIVKAIIEGHSGQVQVESNMGQGTCVTIDIPLDQNSST